MQGVGKTFAVPVQADGKVVRSAVVVQELVHFDIVDEDVGVWDRECPCAIRTPAQDPSAVTTLALVRN